MILNVKQIILVLKYELNMSRFHFLLKNSNNLD